MDIYKDFNFRLREYILKKHGSVSAFCRVAGIKYPAQMTPYLQGKSVPGRKMLEKLQKDGADIDWILHGEKTHSPAAGLGGCLKTSGYKVEMDDIIRRMRRLCRQMDESFPTPFDTYIVLDSTLLLGEFTDSLERFLGYEPGALKGVHFLDLFHSGDRKSARCHLESCDGGSSPSETISRFRSAGGRYVSAEWSIQANHDAGNGKKEYVIIARRREAFMGIG
ncbi:PAS domain-containing protein [Prosthecochloris sp. GSB1]|uniref:PAS domain-containing protein n=1 Tax=Prosthecochloris sp. GSB1 TaxID=281093 RepID=UPI00142E3987|nr:PAS domain-containing protein [Prosthecochloris sp. GSB1]